MLKVPEMKVNDIVEVKFYNEVMLFMLLEFSIPEKRYALINYKKISDYKNAFINSWKHYTCTGFYSSIDGLINNLSHRTDDIIVSVKIV